MKIAMFQMNARDNERLLPAFLRDGVLLAALPGIVTHAHTGKTASVADEAVKQVVAAVGNARDSAQAVTHARTTAWTA